MQIFGRPFLCHWRSVLSFLCLSSFSFFLVTACHSPANQGELRPNCDAYVRDAGAHFSDDESLLNFDVSAFLSLHQSAAEAVKTACSALSFDYQEAYAADFLRQSEESILSSAFHALVLTPSSQGARLAFAIQLAKALPQYRPQAVALIAGLSAASKGDGVSLTADVDDILQFYIGDLSLDLARSHNDFVKVRRSALTAATAFEQAIKRRHSAFYHRARSGQLWALILAKEASLSQIEAFLEAYPDYPRAERLRLEMVKLALSQGKRERAAQVLTAIIYDTPWSREVREARDILEREGLDLLEHGYEEDLSRVDFLRRRRFWPQAEKAVLEARAKYPDSMALRFQEARIPYEQSNYDPSIPLLEQIYEDLDGEKKDDIRPRLINAYLQSAYAYKGDCEKALAYASRNSERLGRSARLRAELKAARDCGDFDVAYENAKRLRPRRPSAKDDDSFAFLAYLAGDYAGSRQVYAQALKGLSGTYVRRASYFYAQATLKLAMAKLEAEGLESDQERATQEKRSKTRTKSKGATLPEPTLEEAKALFETLIQNNDGDYYALLAYSRLEEMAHAKDPTHQLEATPMCQKLALDGHVDLEQIQTDKGQRKWQETYDFVPDYDADAVVVQSEKWRSYFPALARVRFLHEARLYKERNAEFRPIAIEAMGITRLSRCPKPSNLWGGRLSVDGHMVDNRRRQKGVWGCDLEHYYFDLPGKRDKRRQAMAERQSKIFDNGRAIDAFISDALLAFEDYYLVRRYVASSTSSPSLRYPHAYKKAIIREALRNALTPDLMWTVMNIESAFNHDSISHADAFGLLQIIPMTGYKIASAFGLEEFGPYELIEAEKSIPMGTWYFGQVLRKFEGYATLALAGYNGGPHYVARWLTAYAAKVEHDAFVELIPFNEARNYVKKGAARLLIYRRINSGNPQAFYRIPNTMPKSFGEMPNY